MFNPFLRFDKRFIDSFKNSGRRYLVSQTFTREDNLFKDGERKYLLISYYDDLGRAEQHLNALGQDTLASIIDLHKEAHRAKLESILQPDSKYVVYCAFVADTEAVNRTVKKLFGDKIKKYIDHYKQWHIPRDRVVKSDLEITFGQLFINLSYGRLKARPTLEQIEKLR